MRYLIMTCLCLLYVLSSAQTVQTKYVGGIQINEADQSIWAQSLKEAGMNLVQVTSYARQGNWNSDNLTWRSQDTIRILDEIRAAKDVGLHFIMVLRVEMLYEGYNNKFLWHGMTFPTTIYWV